MSPRCAATPPPHTHSASSQCAARWLQGAGWEQGHRQLTHSYRRGGVGNPEGGHEGRRRVPSLPLPQPGGAAAAPATAPTRQHAICCVQPLPQRSRHRRQLVGVHISAEGLLHVQAPAGRWARGAESENVLSRRRLASSCAQCPTTKPLSLHHPHMPAHRQARRMPAPQATHTLY